MPSYKSHQTRGGATYIFPICRHACILYYVRIAGRDDRNALGDSKSFESSKSSLSLVADDETEFGGAAHYVTIMGIVLRVRKDNVKEKIA